MRPRLVATAVFAVVAALGVTQLGVGAAAQRPTLVVRPTKLGPLQNATLFGVVPSRRAGEAVELQARDCGLSRFTGVDTMVTEPGGRWTREYSAGVNSTLRVVWKGVASAPVVVRQAPRIQLDRRSAREWEVGVGSAGHMWRKRVLFQRRAGRAWVTVRTVVLTETYSQPGYSGTWTESEFRATVPRGTLVRAVLPAAEAKPCYLPSISNTLRA